MNLTDPATFLRRLPISQRITQIMLANAIVVLILITLAWFGVDLFTTQSDRLAELARTSHRVESVGIRCTGLALFLRQHMEDRTSQAGAQAEAMVHALLDDISTLSNEFKAVEAEFGALSGAVRRLFQGFRNVQALDRNLETLYRADVLATLESFRSRAASLRNVTNERHAEGLVNSLEHVTHLGQLAASSLAALYLARDTSEASLARAHLRSLTSRLTALRPHTETNAEAEAVERLAALARDLAATAEALEAQVQQRLRLLTAEVDGGQAAIAPAVDRILAWNDHRERVIRDQVAQEVVRNALLASLLAGVLFTAATLLSWGIVRSISRPLATLMDVVRRLAPEASGLRDPHSGDEIAALDHTVRATLALKGEKDRLLAEKDVLITELESEKARADTTLRDLKQANEELEAIFVNSLVGIAAFDNQGGVLKANRRFAAIFGLDEGEDFVGVTAESLHRSAEEYLVFREMYYKRVGQEELLQVEIPLRRKNGTPIWCQISAKLVDPADPARGLIVVFDDVTGKKRVREELGALNRHLEQLVLSRTRDLAEKAKELESKAQQLEEVNIRLRELDRMKSDFLSSVSHELRTPLTSVLGFAKLIRREFARALEFCTGETCLVPMDKAGRIDKNLDIIVQESQRLTAMINDVLDLTKIEDGRMEWRDDRLQPERAVERAASSAAGMIAEKPGLALSVAVEPDLPPILADPDRVHQVLMNLISNAIKFSDRGTVLLRAARSEGDMVRFSVSDQGVGIPDEDLERIFDKFHQASQGDILRNKVKGTGLGLPICKEIISHYHGHIWAESAPGQGSSFHILLPAA